MTVLEKTGYPARLQRSPHAPCSGCGSWDPRRGRGLHAQPGLQRGGQAHRGVPHPSSPTCPPRLVHAAGFDEDIIRHAQRPVRASGRHRAVKDVLRDSAGAWWACAARDQPPPAAAPRSRAHRGPRWPQRTHRRRGGGPAPAPTSHRHGRHTSTAPALRAVDWIEGWLEPRQHLPQRSLCPATARCSAWGAGTANVGLGILDTSRLGTLTARCCADSILHPRTRPSTPSTRWGGVAAAALPMAGNRTPLRPA
ncbi:hypothetical protein QJS66_19815 [Kocuria rhizophila]|nr:hypothetical protein QJS66_19815 [Kocuria rhizophila]